MSNQQQSAILLASDQSGSALKRLNIETICSIAYSPFGHQLTRDQDTISAFNGQLRERLLHIYLLGNGYRAFDTILQRFHSPDSLSPFDDGGLNAYAYCLGDPVNQSDPSGHFSWRKLFGWIPGVSSKKSTGKISRVVKTKKPPLKDPFPSKTRTQTTAATIGGGTAPSGVSQPNVNSKQARSFKNKTIVSIDSFDDNGNPINLYVRREPNLKSERKIFNIDTRQPAGLGGSVYYTKPVKKTTQNNPWGFSNPANVQIARVRNANNYPAGVRP